MRLASRFLPVSFYATDSFSHCNEIKACFNLILYVHSEKQLMKRGEID